jgi:hypothetical protein
MKKLVQATSKIEVTLMMPLYYGEVVGCLSFGAYSVVAQAIERGMPGMYPPFTSTV